MLLPTRSADLAAVAVQLRAAAAAADAGWAAARGEVAGWRGLAAAAAWEGREVLAGRAAVVRDVAAQAAEVFAGLARQVQALEAEAARLPPAGLVAADAVAGLAAGRRRAELGGDYVAASARAAGRLDGLRDSVGDRPLSLGDHVVDFGEAVWAGVVVGTVQGVWGLTGQVFTDPARWWANVTGVPAAAAAMVSDPVGTVRGTVAAEEWEAGRYGAGLGGAVAGVAGMGRRGLLPKAGVPEQFRRNLADRDAPLPRLQSVDELLVRVDLSAHEHHSLGHTIRRHIAVTEEYLRDRVRNGTLLDSGKRGFKPTIASRWKDQETAERSITEVLRENEARLRAWATDRTDTTPLQLQRGGDEVLGEYVRRADPDGSVGQGRTAVVRLAKRGGQVIITTAFVDP